VKGYGFITPEDNGPEVFLHQSVIQMPGFRSLAEGERIEFECRPSEKGLEATFVCGVEGAQCRGSDRRPVSKKKVKKLRCYNCGEFASHIASKCPQGPLPKRCHFCKSDGHLIADCPDRTISESSASSSMPSSDPTQADPTRSELSPSRPTGSKSTSGTVRDGAEKKSFTGKETLSGVSQPQAGASGSGSRTSEGTGQAGSSSGSKAGAGPAGKPDKKTKSESQGADIKDCDSSKKPSSEKFGPS